ncbi:hypothetical protein HWV62_33491 [Athelia sp. TMB]|nr:hypothetical protein HWV62_33491 [Athelia sp. TMB]
MPGVPEIFVFEATKDYQENPEAATAAAVGEVKGVAGIEASYHGFQYADEVDAGVKKAVWVNVWASYDSAPAEQDHLTTQFKPENKPQLTHVRVRTDAAPALAAPCTEIATLTLKPGESAEALGSFLDALKSLFAAGAGHHAMAWGPTVENPNVFVGILGWDTREAHIKAVAPGTEAYDIIQKMDAIAPVTLFHADLKKFSA